MQQVLRIKISTPQVLRPKISTQQVPWTKSVSRREKSMLKFRKITKQQVSRTKNHPKISSTNRNEHIISSMNKISLTRRKIKDRYHEEKNLGAASLVNKYLHATSFTKKNQHAASSRKKITTQQVP